MNYTLCHTCACVHSNVHMHTHMYINMHTPPSGSLDGKSCTRKDLIRPCQILPVGWAKEESVDDLAEVGICRALPVLGVTLTQNSLPQRGEALVAQNVFCHIFYKVVMDIDKIEKTSRK